MEQTKKDFPYFPVLDELRELNVGYGIVAKSVWGERLMTVIVDLPAGIEVPNHHHPHEQMGYIISGEIEFNIGEEIKICRAGDIYFVPSNVIHAVKVMADGPVRLMESNNP